VHLLSALFFLGPGLAIRVICAEEPFVCKDFAETNNILKIITDFSASVKKVSSIQSHTYQVTDICCPVF